MRKSARLSETITELGNALTAGKWPAWARKAAQNDTKVYKTKEIYKELVYLACDMQSMESDLHDCVNELCLKCGNYHESYAGACNGCRWKQVKEDFR